MTNSLGFDISSGDGFIDWPLAASRGIRFATIRATWGLDGLDSRYLANLNGALAAGIKPISYAWFVPRKNTIAQAYWFTSHALPSELGYMIDLEDTTWVKGYHGIWPEIKKWMTATGARKIYASPSYIKSYLYDCPDINDYELIIANWDVAAPGYAKPVQPTRWWAWQYTGKAYGPYYGLQAKEAALYVYNGELP